MPLTKDFKETVGARLARSAGFRKEVLREAVEHLLAGELETGKALLRDYINGTIGFDKLATLTGMPVKSLMRMLGPSGNPQARNMFDLLRQVQVVEGSHFAVLLRKSAPSGARTLKPASSRATAGVYRAANSRISDSETGRPGRRRPISPGL